MFSPQSGGESTRTRLKKIDIERKRLELEKEQFLFQQEKAKANLELRRMENELKLESKRSMIQLENLLNTQGITRRDQNQATPPQADGVWKQICSRILDSDCKPVVFAAERRGIYPY